MITFTAGGAAYQTDRIIGDTGPAKGPTMVFLGGIHGNEPSGVIALQRVLAWLEEHQIQLRGRLIGIAGNLAALAAHRRFLGHDLNRMWRRQFLSQEALQAAPNPAVPEERELREIYDILQPLLQAGGELYFLDLHTTSSDSDPFIAINDQLNNRAFALQFPVPTVLGIEEFLEGPLLSYLNDFGYVALAFEAGQHDDPQSIDLHMAFVLRALWVAGLLPDEALPPGLDLAAPFSHIPAEHRGIFEVLHRHAIVDEDRFQMNPGFENFRPIAKGQPLGSDRQGPIESPRRGRIFMPLYQSTGNDGYFIVRRVPGWAMRLSKVLRNINFDRWLVWLPGVSRSPDQPETLVVNRRVAFLLANELFHLLGYRRKKADGHRLIFSRREIH